MDVKKVLVLMSTYDGAKYIIEQLDSIHAQNGADVRLLVRDDGSKDNTVCILKEYADTHPNFIVDITTDSNLGSTGSFCKLVEIANSSYANDYDYFAFADQDDVWLDDKLSSGVERLSRLNENTPNLYFSDTSVVDSNLNKIEGNRARKVNLRKEASLVRNVATGCTMVFNRKAIVLFATHCPEFMKIHDHAMFMLCNFMGDVIYDETPHILYRQHSANQVGGIDNPASRFKERMSGRKRIKAHILERAASSFLISFEDLLNEMDKKTITRFINYRYSLIDKCWLLFNRNIGFERLEDDFFYRLKILCEGL